MKRNISILFKLFIYCNRDDTTKKDVHSEKQSDSARSEYLFYFIGLYFCRDKKKLVSRHSRRSVSSDRSTSRDRSRNEKR